MKRIVNIIMSSAILFAGCSVDQLEDRPMTDAGEIHVTYSLDGVEVNSIELDAQSHLISVDVEINNPGVHWTPSSDQPWCKVIEEKHYGNGAFKLKIDANDGFFDREEATITFKVGVWEESVLKITQEGNAVLMDKRYVAITKSATTTRVQLTTPYEYELEQSDWVGVEVASKATSADETGRSYDVITFDVKVSENTSESRYGYLSIKRKGQSAILATFNIWQYGSDIEYDEQGDIVIPGRDAEPFEMRVPVGVVDEITAPEWVSLSKEENADGTESYWFACQNNPSDAFYLRPMELSLSMTDSDETLDIDFVKQNYYPVGGIISCHGLKLFAQTYNQGGDCSTWYTDGKPLILEDIDMAEVEDWEPIGTSERPFTGEFDGGQKTISNFISSKPFFGYCSEANISNFIFDQTVNVALSGNVNGPQRIASLAYSINSNTLVDNCISGARVALDGMIAASDIEVCVGGLIADSDATSKIINSSFSGKVENQSNSSTSTSTDAWGTAFVGGIVAKTSGKVENCTFDGSILHSSAIKIVYTGGITGRGETGTLIKGNINNGSISYSSLRKVAGVTDASRANYAGGIVGVTYGGEYTGNTFNGWMNANSDIKSIMFGGIVGGIYNNTSRFKNNTTTPSSKIIATGEVRYVNLGGLVGLIEKDSGACSFDFTDDTGTFSGEISGGRQSEGHSVGYCYMGGLIGSTDIDVNLVNPKWSGFLEIDLTNDVTWDNLAAGGVIGAVGKYSSSDVPTSVKASISGASSSGVIAANSSRNTITARISMGGLVGWNNGGLTITDSNFTGEVTWLGNDGRADATVVTCGGIVGSIESGDSSISNCHSSGNIFNWHYNNNGPAKSGVEYMLNYTGGIIGTYGYQPSVSSSLTIDTCTSISSVGSFRGGVGGIAGYLKNATVRNSSFKGSIALDSDSGRFNCLYGGIVATGAKNAIFSNCVVKSDLSGMFTGNSPIRGGGIAAVLENGGTISNCRFYGTVDLPSPDSRDEYCGGLVGHAQSGSTIKDSSFGGYVRSVYVNTDSLAAQHASGTATISKTPSEGTVSNITYWNGQE